jgi:hypothetical protein
MKKHSTFSALLIFLFAFTLNANAQYVNVPEIIQEQNQWCWAASTKCVLDYFNTPEQQCAIADYTRTVAPWHSYGTVDCCLDPSQGCNYWNYNWGYAGSMQDILNNFAGIQTNNYGSVLSPSQITTELSAGRPFIFRWGWYSGGGHFLVGHGYNGTDLYYMNPLPGYGYEIATYNWVVDDGSSHTWTHSQTLVVPATGVSTLNNKDESLVLYPNPANGNVMVRLNEDLHSPKINICNSLGETVYEELVTTSSSKEISLKYLAAGIYVVKVSDGEKLFTKELVVE